MAGASNARTNKKKYKGRKVTDGRWIKLPGHQDELDPPDKPVLLADPSFEEWMMIILGVSEEMLSDNNTEYLLPWINVEDNTHEMPEDVFFTREALRLLYPRMPKIWKVTDETLLKPGKKKEVASGGGHRRFGLREHRDTLVNPWAYLTCREQAICKKVNDPDHPDYNEEHEYFGRSAIGRRPKDLPEEAEWENDSIMLMMKKKFNDNKEKIILDMINEEGPDTYWKNKSPATKNSYIEKIKKEYPLNRQIAALKQVEEPIANPPWIWYTREQNKIRTRIRGGSATNPSTPEPEHPYFHTDFIRKGKHSFLDMLAEQYNKNKEHIFMEYIKSSEFAENLDKDRMAFLRKAMEEFPKNQTFRELDKAFDRCVIHVDPERCNDPNYGYIEVNTVSKSGRVIGVTPINNPIPRAIWVNNKLNSFF